MTETSAEARRRHRRPGDHAAHPASAAVPADRPRRELSSQGVSLTGVKCVTINEPFFQGHFPGAPVMPGVLIIEAMAQTGGLLMSKSWDADPEGKIILFMSVDNCRFRSPVYPGAVLQARSRGGCASRRDVVKFNGRAMVEGKLAAQAEFAAMLVRHAQVTAIHPTAIVDGGCRAGRGRRDRPLLHRRAGGRCSGAGVRLVSHVVIEGPTTIGADCVLHPFVVLGSAPQHAGYRGEPTRLEIGERNVIREQVTMHRGTPQGRGRHHASARTASSWSGVHIAHDCTVGDRVTLVNNATLGGHVVVEDYVIMGGLSAAHQYTRIGRHAFIGGMAGVNHDVIPFGNVWGNHAHLEGLNLVGLKRRGFSREAINTLRAAYRMLFAEEGTFQERLEDTAAAYAHSPEVMEIVDFIRADSSRAR